MRSWSLTAIRCLATAALVLTAFAIGLGRWQTKSDEVRIPSLPLYHPIQKYQSLDPDLGTPVLDVLTGKLTRLELPETDTLVNASCSPWRDNLGRFHVVGSWRSRPHKIWDPKNRSGLARFAFPGGEPLDRIEFHLSLEDPPCWAPDTSGRVLCVAGDCRIYTLAFKKFRNNNINRDTTPQLTKLTWKVPVPRENHFLISHVTWPNDLRFSNIVVVSASDSTRLAPLLGHVPVGLPLEGQHLWWLRLSRDRHAVEAAGRLWPSNPALDQAFSERLPNLIRTPQGDLVLAYLRCRKAPGDTQLMLAPVTLSTNEGVPQVDPKQAIELANQCLMSPPGFSQDGRSIFAIQANGRNRMRLLRYSVEEAMARRQASTQSLHPEQAANFAE